MTRVLVACVGAVAVAWWLGSKQAANIQSTPPPPPHLARIASPVEAAVTVSRTEEHGTLPEQVTPVSHKYAVLLDQLPPLTASRLQTLLAASYSPVRERELSLLLNAEEYSLYEQLRESDDIQAHLQSFASQVQTTSPLDPQQQRALLLAKLNHSAAVQLLVLDPQLDALALPVMERAYARDLAIAGIDHHQRAFLDEVRAVLTTDQWSALAEFERIHLSGGRSAVPPENQPIAFDNP